MGNPQNRKRSPLAILFQCLRRQALLFLAKSTLSRIFKSCYTITVVFCPNLWQQRGGDALKEFLISLGTQVMAAVTAYYLCKWLDWLYRKYKDN